MRRCPAIEGVRFDWSKLVRPWLVPAVESEKAFSPVTSLYVWEGVHSTIVLAVGLLGGTIDWHPVDVIRCLERPSA